MVGGTDFRNGFIVSLRHPSFDQLELIHHCIGIIGMDAGDHLIAAGGCGNIDPFTADGRLYILGGSDIGNIVIIKAIAGIKRQVTELCTVHPGIDAVGHQGGGK